MEEKKVEEVNDQKKVISNEKDIKLPEKNNGSNKILIIIIVVLSLALIAGGVYFGFVKKSDSPNNGSNSNNQQNNNQEQNNNVDDDTLKYIHYKSKDGKEIKLVKASDEYNDVGDVLSTSYRLWIGDELIEVKSFFGDKLSNNLFIVHNDNYWYLLDETRKEIVLSYKMKDKYYYDHEEIKNNGNNQYIIIYSDYSSNKKIMHVINTINGEIINFNSNYPEDYYVINNNIYFKQGSSILKYNILDGKLNDTIKYDNIINYGSSISDFIAVKNNNYYIVSIEKDFSETKIKKLDTYVNDRESMTVFEDGKKKIIYVVSKIDEINEFYDTYTGDHEAEEAGNYKYDEDDNYAVYSFGGSMCGNNVLLNKKTKKIEGHDSNYSFIKGSQGYYLLHGECVTDWGRTYTYTSSWKKIGESFIMNSDEVDNAGNVYVANNGYVEIRNINGELVEKSKDYKEIGGGLINNNTLYVVVRENKKVYLVSLNSKLEELSKTEINTSSYEEFFPWLELKNGKLEIAVTNADGQEAIYNYDFSSKKLTKVESN